MSDFAPASVISVFAETNSSIGEVASGIHPISYPDPLAEIVAEEEAARSVVRERFAKRGQSNDEKEMFDVVGATEFGERSGAESEGFTFVDALRRASLVAASDPETIIDTSGMPTCKYHFYENLWLFFHVNRP